MNANRLIKAQAIAAMLALVVSQGCQTLSRDKTQPVPATSRPPGVTVLIDGKPAGKTPLILNLARRDIHVVRFESDGYRTVEIRISQRRPPLGETILTSFWWAPVGGIVLGPPVHLIWDAFGGPPEEGLGRLVRGFFSFLGGAVAGWAIGTSIDHTRPSNYDLTPRTLYVEMEKGDDILPPTAVVLERTELARIRWIRISAK